MKILKGEGEVSISIGNFSLHLYRVGGTSENLEMSLELFGDISSNTSNIIF